MPAQDGFYLVNCTKDNDRRSGVAFYRDFSQQADGNDGQQPDDFVYTDFGNFTHWEGAQESATFSNGVKVFWKIRGNGGDADLAEAVGTASNTFENWTVFKDKGSFMFQNADGYDCNKIYWAN